MYSTFPFPQATNKNIGIISTQLNELRLKICQEYKIGLTEMYNIMYDGGFRELFVLHEKLDKEVFVTYRMPKNIYHSENMILEFLFQLNKFYSNNNDNN
jgi:hypothetical protein